MGSTAVALAGGVEAASAAGAAVTAGEGGVGATVAGAVAAGAMPDGAIRMAMAMTMGRDGVPITRATATPPPTVEAAPAGSIAKSGRSQADEAATSGGGSSTSANRSPERRTPASYFVFFAAR